MIFIQVFVILSSYYLTFDKESIKAHIISDVCRLISCAKKIHLQKIRLMPDVWFVLQDLLLGDHCCVDIMGATQFKTPRANWDKRCCSNPKGPVVELANDLSPQDAKKIDKQIERMPHLKQVLVWHALVLPLEKPFSRALFL